MGRVFRHPVLVLLLLAGALSGCGRLRTVQLETRPRAPGEPTAWGRCEALMEAGSRALDKVDAALENTIW